MVKNHLKINIGGKEVGLTFGLLQVKLFEKALVGNLDLYFDDQFISDAGLARLIHSAHQNHRFLNPNEPGISAEEIYEWILSGFSDEAVKSQLVEVVNVWQASEHTQTWLDELKKKTAAAQSVLDELKQPRKKSKEDLSKSRPRSGQKATRRKK